MLPRHSSPDSVLWSVIVSRVPWLISFLKPGRSGPQKRVTVVPRDRLKPPSQPCRRPPHSSGPTLRRS
jgi:hypothetical protein